MTIKNTCLAAIYLALVSATAVGRVPADGVQSDFTLPRVGNQIVVKLAQDVDPTVATQLLSPFGAVIVDQIEAAGLVVVRVNSDTSLPAAIAIANGDPRLEFAEPNFIYSTQARPNDLDFAQQWAKENTGVNAPMGLGTPGADLNLVEAWDTRASAPGVVVAIIDDGVDTTHVDLAGNVMVTGKCFASPNSPRPCTNGPDDPSPADSSDFHGTLVAGTAGARGNNALGIAGTAWEVALLPLKVDLSIVAIVRAVDEALAQNAAIINMSFGGPGNSSALSEAVDRALDAGVLIVASAGNADASNDNASHYPSGYPHPNVLSVAASNSTDSVAAFSQWGSLSVDLAAPGEQTRTTAINNGYAVVNGTSFSAPHVAGVAALVNAHTGANDYATVVAHLLAGTVDGAASLGAVVPGQNKQAVPGRVATGRLDAARALQDLESGVLLIDAIEVDDSVSGNSNGRLDPGETATLQVILRNRWQNEPTVAAALSTPDSDVLTVNDTLPVVFGDVARDGTASAGFSVTLAAGATGHAALLLQFDFSSAGGSALPSRYAYLETGTLANGTTVTQSMNRWNWDEFHAWHIDVPAGSTELTIGTAGDGDVDLLVRYAQPPSYLITLDAQRRGVDGFYYADGETLVSGEADSGEFLRIASPQPGTYHIVVLNYGKENTTYDLTASYVAAGADVIAFTVPTVSAAEGDGNVQLDVVRSGGLQAASVDFRSIAGTAAVGIDFEATSGTLEWGLGESGVKSISVSLIDDGETDDGETFTLELSNVTGARLGTPNTATVTINDNDGAADPADPPPAPPGDESPPPVQPSGGGGASGLWFLIAAIGSAAGRRRLSPGVGSDHRIHCYSRSQSLTVLILTP